MNLRFLALAATCAIAFTGCVKTQQVSKPRFEYPPAPPSSAATEPVLPPVSAALAEIAEKFGNGEIPEVALRTLAASSDARLGWFLSDLLRFTPEASDQARLVKAFRKLTGVDPARDPQFIDSPWKSITDHLIAWDLPAHPGYADLKHKIFLKIEPGWEPLFADSDSKVDWRLISWGGVGIDNRREGSRVGCPQGCIPALDDPPLVQGARGDWYRDDGDVFAAGVGDEIVAFPRNIMEVHEMVNITIGGRRVGIPYCTLCGSAQAYFTDRLAQPHPRVVLRTSGLLSRSNKVMYDLLTSSIFDTFTGAALSGPLRQTSLQLEEIAVVASTWGEWRREHPDSFIVAQGAGLGRFYPEDPLEGRDDDGPIFPTGSVDPRLPVQELVLGVIAPDKTPVAFPVAHVRETLAGGREVTASGIKVVEDGGGLRALTSEGAELPSHQAFWFAWSQFHPKTLVWRRGNSLEESVGYKLFARNRSRSGFL